MTDMTRVKLVVGAYLVVLGWLAFAVGAQTPPLAKANDAIGWDYDDKAAADGQIAQFNICVDGQPTTACAVVLVTSGVDIAGALGTKTYTWKFPAMTAGAHRAAVQACTLGGNQCTGGIVLAVTWQVVLTEVKNVRLVKAGGP